MGKRVRDRSRTGIIEQLVDGLFEKWRAVYKDMKRSGFQRFVGVHTGRQNTCDDDDTQGIFKKL